MRHWLAVAEAALVALIWASSLVLVKWSLSELGPLTVAGLRYFLAFLLLWPFTLRNRRAVEISPRLWWRFGWLGLSVYLVGNGSLFWALQVLPATTGAFLLNLIPLLVLGVGWVWLKEVPSRLQLIGIVVSLTGVILYLGTDFAAGEPLGLAVALLGLLGFLFFSVAGREVAREGRVGVLSLTTYPLAFGGGAALGLAVVLEGVPRASWPVWGAIFGLAAVNTALAYLLYNHALQRLTAFEINAVLNLVPLGTAVMAWLFLGERLTSLEAAGILVAVLGVGLVQWRRSPVPLPVAKDR